MIELTGSLICRTGAEADRVRSHLPEHIRLSRAEPGCLSFEVVPTDDPLIWAVAERYEDRSAFQAHQARIAGTDWATATVGIRREYQISGD